MKARVIDSSNELTGIKEIWNNILAQSGSDMPFLTWEWQSTWWHAFGQGKELMILISSKEDEPDPLGIAPFVLRKRAGFKIIEFIGTGNSDYLDFIIKKENADVIYSFFDLLDKKYRNKWDLIHLKDILCTSKNIPLILRQAKRVGWLTFEKKSAIYPFLMINQDWQRFLSKKSSNFRYAIKKHEGQLRKSDLNIHIEKRTMVDSRDFHDLVEIEKNSWKSATGAARLQSAPLRDFYLAFLKQFVHKGWVNLWIAYIGNKPVSYLINFDYRDKIWFYNSAYDRKSQKIGVGSILSYLAIKDAFNNKKKEYDFLKGAETFKSRWTSDFSESLSLFLLKKTPRSLLAYLVNVYLVRAMRKLGLNYLSRLGC